MANPDIRLLFGVTGDGGIDVGGSGAEIKSKILEIISKLESTGITKIAFGVDEVATQTNIENAIKAILPKIQANLSVNVTPVVNNNKTGSQGASGGTVSVGGGGTSPVATAARSIGNNAVRGSVNVLNKVTPDDQKSIEQYVQDIRDHIETETKKVTKMTVTTQLKLDPLTKQPTFDIAHAEITEINKELGQTSKHLYAIQKDANGAFSAMKLRTASTAEPEKYNKVFDAKEQTAVSAEAEKRITKLSSAAQFLSVDLTKLNTMSKNIFDTESLAAFNQEFKTIDNTINGTKATLAKTLNPITSIKNELKNFPNTVQKLQLSINGLQNTTPITELQSKLAAAKLEAERLLTPTAGTSSKQRQDDLKKWQDSVQSLEKELKLLETVQRDTNKGVTTNNHFETLVSQLENYRLKYAAGIKSVPGLDQSFDSLKTNLQSGMFATQQLARQAVLSLTAQARDAGVQVETLGQKIKRLFGNNFASAIAAIGIHLITRNIGELYQNVVKVDEAITQLRKVSDATFSELADVLDVASVKAVKLGVSISDLVTAAAGFARLGFNIIDSEQLGEAATILYNVGDELDSIEGATSAIVSAMYAFKVSSSEVMTIVDKMNALSNKFSISTGGAADALSRSGAALATAGNDLNQSLALVVGGNLVTQNADIAGTALKTMALRLRGAKVELEDAGLDTDAMAVSVSTLREKILALTNVTGDGGFDILNDKGQFKSTYDMMEGISSSYMKMTNTINQAALLELISGKRGASVAASILLNFETVSKAYQASLNSEGSAFAEHAKWLDSIEGRTGQLGAQFQALSVAAINSKFAKTIISGGTGIISVLTKIIDLFGALPALMSAVAGAAALKGNVGNSNVNMPRFTSLSVAA